MLHLAFAGTMASRVERVARGGFYSLLPLLRAPRVFVRLSPSPLARSGKTSNFNGV
jgi:hypothetical protein